MYNCQLQPLKYFGLVSSLKQVYNSSITQNPTLSIPQDSLLTLFLRTQKELRSSTKNLSVKKGLPWWEVKQNGTLQSPKRDVLLIGTQHIPWHSSVLKARRLLIFSIDFCIEYFPQTNFWKRLVSSKTQTAHDAVPLMKISLIFSGTVQKFKLFGELWLKSLLISTLYLETTRWKLQFF